MTTIATLNPPPDQWRRLLRRGMRGADVGSWQRVLIHSGYSLDPWGDDEDFGRLTEKRTIQFQVDRGLTPDGVVGPQTRANIMTPAAVRVSDPLQDTEWAFVQAANWRWANRQEFRLIVIHTMETPETSTMAEAIAAWFAGHRGSPPMASAHICVDDDSIVRCVRPEHIAFAAPGANHDGYQVELAGRASQTREQWTDPYSTAMLRLAARHVAKIASRYNVPLVKLTVDEVKNGKSRGFCGHVDATYAFRKSTHVDPGPNFPWESFLRMVGDAQRREVAD